MFLSAIKKINLGRIILFVKDKLTIIFPFLGAKSYTKFIILSDYRTGSNYLMNLIKSHPNAHCYSELFFSRKIFWASAIYGHGETNKKILNERAKNPYLFLDKYCYRRYSKSLKSIGFKLMYHDIYKNKNISLNELLTHYPDLKIIHLKRKNLLKRFVSQQYVAKTGEAVAIDKEAWKNKSGNLSKFKIIPEILKDDFLYREKIIEELDNIIITKNCNYLEVFYEDLQENCNSVLDKVLPFLKLRHVELHTKQIKQSKDSVSESIENYSELKEHFKNTKWSVFFD